VKRIQIYEHRGIDKGLEILSEKLREEGIPEEKIINITVTTEATYFTAYIRENTEFKIYEEMRKKIDKAEDLLHRFSMRFSSGQAIHPGDNLATEVREYLANYNKHS